MSGKQRIFENPKCDSDLPLYTREKIEKLVAAGWPREVLLITRRGDVVIDPEAISYDQHIQSQTPGRPRSEYMVIEYPTRIYVDENTSDHNG
jgi:hypothetical protein